MTRTGRQRTRGREQKLDWLSVEGDAYVREIAKNKTTARTRSNGRFYHTRACCIPWGTTVNTWRKTTGTPCSLENNHWGTRYAVAATAVAGEKSHLRIWIFRLQLLSNGPESFLINIFFWSAAFFFSRVRPVIVLREI